MRAKTKKWFSPLFVLTLAVAGIFGVSAAVVDKQVEETPQIEVADAAAEYGLTTKIILKDTITWNFRTLWISDVKNSARYESGYDFEDLKTFVRSYYVTKKDSWDKEGSEKAYHIYDTDPTEANNGVNLCAGGTSKNYEFYLPAWLKSCKVEVQNNENTLSFNTITAVATTTSKASGPSGNAGSGVGKIITLEIKNNSGAAKGEGSITNTKTYFDPVTVNRYYFTSLGTAKAADSTTNRMYYFPEPGTVPDIEGLTKESSSWYSGTTYAGATSVYTTTDIITSSSAINLVAKYSESGIDSSVQLLTTRVQVEDVTNKGWTGETGCSYAVLDIYNISFGTSGYTISNIKSGDIECQSYVTGSNWIHVEMKKKPDSGETFYAVFPWYFASFECKFYASKSGEGDRYWYQAGTNDIIEREVTRGTNWIFKSDSDRAGWGGSNFYTDVTTYKTDEGTYKYTFYGIKSGSHMYLDTTNYTGWENDNAKLALYFCRSNENISGVWGVTYNNVERGSATLDTSFCWKVQGSGNDHLYECIVPQYSGHDVYWSTVIAVRDGDKCTSPTFDTSSGDSGKRKWDQTGDQYYHSGDAGWNIISISGSNTGSLSGRLVNAVRAEYYGQYFNDTIVCNNAGSYDGTWNDVKNEYYQHLSTAVQGIVYSAYEDPNHKTELGFAMSKYDYICHKYGVSTYDFIGRGSGAEHSRGWIYGSINKVSPYEVLTGSNDDNISTIIIIIASSISLLSITALSILMVKKKKSANK